jgi:hypothetical protein
MKIDELIPLLPSVTLEDPYTAVFAEDIYVFDAATNRFGVLKLGSPVRDLAQEMFRLWERGREPDAQAERYWAHGVIVLIFSEDEHTKIGYIDANSRLPVIFERYQDHFEQLMMTSREVSLTGS